MAAPESKTLLILMSCSSMSNFWNAKKKSSLFTKVHHLTVGEMKGCIIDPLEFYRGF